MALSIKEVEHVALLACLKLNAQEKRLFPCSLGFRLEPHGGLFQLNDEHISLDIPMTRTVMAPVSPYFFITLRPEIARCQRRCQW
jgi:hypothetical protein